MRLLVPLVASLAMALDLLTKLWAKSNLISGQALIPGIRLVLTTNKGVAFGIGRDNGPAMIILPIFVLMLVIFWIYKHERSAHWSSHWQRIGMGLLVGGALGNISERIVYGHVTDFMEFTFVSFPVFNLADVFIDLGAALIVWQLFCRSG